MSWQILFLAFLLSFHPQSIEADDDDDDDEDDDDDDDDSHHDTSSFLKESQKDQECLPHEQYEWDPWSQWSKCSVTCATGVRSRNRKCKDLGSKKTFYFKTSSFCEGSSNEQESCTQKSCPNDKSGKPEHYESSNGENDDIRNDDINVQGDDGNNQHDEADDGYNEGDFDDYPDDEFRGPRERADSLGDGGASDRCPQDYGENVDQDQADGAERCDAEYEDAQYDDADEGQTNDRQGQAHDETEAHDDTKDQGHDDDDDHDDGRDADDGDDDVHSQPDNDIDDDNDDDGEEDEEDGAGRGKRKRHLEEEEDEEEEDKDEEEEDKKKHKKKKKKKKKKRRKLQRKQSVGDKSMKGMTSADECSGEEGQAVPQTPGDPFHHSPLSLQPRSEDVMLIRSRSSSESESDSNSCLSYEYSSDSEPSSEDASDTDYSAACSLGRSVSWGTEGSLADESSLPDGSLASSRDISLDDFQGILKDRSRVASLQNILQQCDSSLQEINDRLNSRDNSLSDIHDILESYGHESDISGTLQNLSTSSQGCAGLEQSLESPTSSTCAQEQFSSSSRDKEGAETHDIDQPVVRPLPDKLAAGDGSTGKCQHAEIANS